MFYLFKSISYSFRIECLFTSAHICQVNYVIFSRLEWVSECCYWNFGLDWSRSFLHNSISHAKSSQKHIASSFSLNSISRPKSLLDRPKYPSCRFERNQNKSLKGNNKIEAIMDVSVKQITFLTRVVQKINVFLLNTETKLSLFFNVHNFVLNNCCKISHFGISICYLELRKKCEK